MKQEEYMNLMDYHFRNVDETSYKEIRNDFEEHFRRGLEDGKTEDEIAQELGNPNEIYEEYKAEGIIEEKSGFDFGFIGEFMETLGDRFIKDNGEPISFVEKREYIEETIHRMEIRSDGFDIRIGTHQEEYIKILYLGKKEEQLAIQIKDSVLKIGNMDAANFLKGKDREVFKDVEILIPEDCDMGINIWSVSGKAELRVGKNDTTVHMGKGNVDCKTNGDNVHIDTFAGTVVYSGDPKQIYIKTVSGNVKVQTKNPAIDIHTAAGNVDLKLDINNKTIIRTVSGNINISSHKLSGKAYISTMSGDLLIEGKHQDPSKIYGKFIERKWSEENHSLELKTISGNITINEDH